MTIVNRIFATGQKFNPAWASAPSRMFHVAHQIKKGPFSVFHTPQRSFSIECAQLSCSPSHPEFINEIKQKANQCLAIVQNAKKDHLVQLEQITKAQADHVANLADICSIHAMPKTAVELYQILKQVDPKHEELAMEQYATNLMNNQISEF